jgi:hypothetical protein
MKTELDPKIGLTSSNHNDAMWCLGRSNNLLLSLEKILLTGQGLWHYGEDTAQSRGGDKVVVGYGGGGFGVVVKDGSGLSSRVDSRDTAV